MADSMLRRPCWKTKSDRSMKVRNSTQVPDIVIIQNHPKLSTNHPQNHPQIIPKLSTNHPKIIPKSSQIIPKSSQNYPQIIPKSSPNHPKIIPNHPKIIPNDPQIIPNSSSVAPVLHLSKWLHGDLAIFQGPGFIADLLHEIHLGLDHQDALADWIAKGWKSPGKSGKSLGKCWNGGRIGKGRGKAQEMVGKSWGKVGERPGKGWNGREMLRKCWGKTGEVVESMLKGHQEDI